MTSQCSVSIISVECLNDATPPSVISVENIDNSIAPTLISVVNISRCEVTVNG